MYFLYVLQSLKKNFLYIGTTSDLKQRLIYHNNGETISTKKFRPLKIVYYEAYLDKNDALEREKKLKQYGSAWGHLKKRIARSLKYE